MTSLMASLMTSLMTSLLMTSLMASLMTTLRGGARHLCSRGDRFVRALQASAHNGALPSPPRSARGAIAPCRVGGVHGGRRGDGDGP
jgi:hypothetical protein